MWDPLRTPVKDAAPPKLERPSFPSRPSDTAAEQKTSAQSSNMDSALLDNLASQLHTFVPGEVNSELLAGQQAPDLHDALTTRKQRRLSLFPITEPVQSVKIPIPVQSKASTTGPIISSSEVFITKNEDAKLTSSTFTLFDPGFFTVTPPAPSPTPTSAEHTDSEVIPVVRITTVVATVTKEKLPVSSPESEHITSISIKAQLTKASQDSTSDPSLTTERETATWKTITIPVIHFSHTSIETPSGRPTAEPTPVITPTLPSAPLYVPPGLTTGQIVGIAMGSLFAVLFLIAISLFSRRLVLRRKRENEESPCSPAETQIELQPQPPTSRFSETPTPPPMYHRVTELGKKTSRSFRSMITSVRRQKLNSAAVSRIPTVSTDASWATGASPDFTRKEPAEMI